MKQFATFAEALAALQPVPGANLEHYGVKGMRWGRRKQRGSRPSGTPTPVTVSTRPGKRVQARGGQNRPASDDARKAAALKQKARASTIDSLSNKEIQDLVARLNLEQQYARLDPPKVNPVKSFVRSILKTELDAAMKGKAGPGVSALTRAAGGEGYVGKRRKK